MSTEDGVKAATVACGAPGRRGVALLIAAALMWSLNGVFIKSLYASGVGGWAIAGYRSLFACLFLTPLMLGRMGRIEDRGWVLGLVIAFTAMCATFVQAMTHTTAANAIVLQYTAPVWVFLLSPWITRERAGRGQVMSLAFSLIGVVVIFGWQFQGAHSGLILGLAAGVVFGIQTVLFRRVRRVSPLVLVWLACGGSGVILLAVSLATERTSMNAGLVGWLALMGLAQFALPYVLYSAGLGRVSAQRGSLVILLEPILSPVWVWLAVGEVPHVSTLVGGGFIMASVLCVMLVRPNEY